MSIPITLHLDHDGDTGYGSECWTVGKALRRLVSHELTHWKSIVRITTVYRERSR